MSAMQFNLLPDVKLEYIKAQRSRNTVSTVAFIATGISIAILVIMLFTVEVVQKKQLNDAASAVTTASKQLSGISNLNKVLTVRNQLGTLATLHQQKHITSRIFNYLPAITPSNVQITQTSLDFVKNTIAITGTASSQLAVNTFVDTLKFTQYQANAQDTKHQAFSAVVESAFSLTNNSATYTIDAQFDPALFTNTGETPQIVLQNQITTRSVLDDPSNTLFTGQQPKAGVQ
jgi:Tfp pilus assembly protein PilN